MVIKKWELSLLIGLISTILFSCISFNAQCYGIRNNVLRLHILANSDSKEDQQLKLKVRDRLLIEGKDLFFNAENQQQAAKMAENQLDLLTKAAEDEIAKSNYNYQVKIEISPTYFETRSYDDITLPAGTYEAVRVLIGEGEGKNWWCVMFPPMCIPVACENSDNKTIDDVLDEDQVDIVKNHPKYEIKFKSVEIYQDIKSTVKGWFS